MDARMKAVFFTVIAGFLWGTSFPAIKIGLQYMDAYTFVFLRFLVASLTMLFILLLTGKPDFGISNKRLIFFLGVINGVAYLLEYVGMVYTTASKSSLFINLSAIWVALLSPLLLKERLGIKKAVGVGVSLVGIVLMTTNLNLSSLTSGDVIGDVLVIGAGVAWALFMVYNKPLASSAKGYAKPMTLLLLFTLLPLLPSGLLSVGLFGSLPLGAWLAILYTGILCWVLPYYLWLRGLRDLSPATSAIVLLTEIVVAVIIAAVVLGEGFTLVSGIGSVLVIIAILLVT